MKTITFAILGAIAGWFFVDYTSACDYTMNLYFHHSCSIYERIRWVLS